MKTLAKTVKLSLAVIASISFVSVSLYAEDYPARGPIPFSSYDVNKDGVISEKEFNDTRAARIEQKAQMGGKMMQGMDNNMQQNMDKNMKAMYKNNMQGMGRSMPAFENIDLNRDGYLSETEMDEFREKRMQDNASQGKMLRNISNKSEFSEIDTNGDGKVSKEEFLSNRARKQAK